MTVATFSQAEKLLRIVAEQGLSGPHLQNILGSGLISDLVHVAPANFSRRELRRLVGRSVFTPVVERFQLPLLLPETDSKLTREVEAASSSGCLIETSRFHWGWIPGKSRDLANAWYGIFSLAYPMHYELLHKLASWAGCSEVDQFELIRIGRMDTSSWPALVSASGFDLYHGDASGKQLLTTFTPDGRRFFDQPVESVCMQTANQPIYPVETALLMRISD